MDLRKLTYFLTVAQQGSFSRGAERLHMTQPPLSTAVADLERELGVRLLTRGARGVTPTAAGRYLVTHGERLVGDLEAIEQDLHKMSRGASGRVSVASTPILTWTLLPGVLQPFLETRPEVDVVVRDAPPAEVIEMVSRGQVDVGVIATVSSAQLRDAYRDTLEVRVVRQLPLAIGLPTRFTDSPPHIPMSELQNETWLVPERSMRIRGLLDTVNSIWEQAGGYTPAVRSVTTMQTAIPLVVAGLGVTLLPRDLATITHPSLVVREIDEHVPDMQAVVIWRAQVADDPTVTSLIHAFQTAGRSGAVPSTDHDQ